jgi:hypothetical protein
VAKSSLIEKILTYSTSCPSAGSSFEKALGVLSVLDATCSNDLLSTTKTTTTRSGESCAQLTAMTDLT